MTHTDYLRVIDGRINSLKINDASSSELIRFETVIRPDILSQMTAEEISAYENSKIVKTPEQIRAERDAIIAQMNENRDKPSH